MPLGQVPDEAKMALARKKASQLRQQLLIANMNQLEQMGPSRGANAEGQAYGSESDDEAIVKPDQVRA